jgi:CheY-like chemotaxis protein
MNQEAQEKMAVLYVEDEPDDVFFMSLAFRRESVQAEFKTVEDGRRAIAYLAGEEAYADRETFPLPRLVLLDLNLPVPSGFEVLQWIRQQEQFRELPVIVFSSSGRPEDRERACRNGATDYFLKPSSGLQFADTVRKLQPFLAG